MKKLISALVILFNIALLSAQDFDCRVSINAQQIPNANQTKVNALTQAINSFINDRKWCNYQLTNNERIEGMMQINLKTMTGDKFEGTMTLQLQRPVYKTNYKTNVLNFQDKEVSFTYGEGEAMEYADNSTFSQLTSIIAFYLNFFLGCDFDSFSLNGGSVYFDKCTNIASLNSNAGRGWSPGTSGYNNRYYMAENMSNATYGKLHEFLYIYHRLGLDVMSESPDQGRSAIMDAMKLLQQVNQVRSNIFMVQAFIQAKADEIINIFKEATPAEKTQIMTIMRQIDPANINKYDVITQTNNSTGGIK
ncbi:MAG: DUF4835 family protein [Bacteroidales bacterium]|jgi:hypothetical protein|nr:DUF4835 family protein [Bacteroidales bacterium]